MYYSGKKPSDNWAEFVSDTMKPTPKPRVAGKKAGIISHNGQQFITTEELVALGYNAMLLTPGSLVELNNDLYELQLQDAPGKWWIEEVDVEARLQEIRDLPEHTGPSSDDIVGYDEMYEGKRLSTYYNPNTGQHVNGSKETP